MRYKEFLLNENQAYLGQKVGDILTSAHDLKDEGKNMGSRDLMKFSEKLVSEIKRVLHSSWPKECTKYLKSLQKVGVGIMKCIDEKGDLYQTILSACAELEKTSKALGVPINKFASPDIPSEEPDSAVGKTEKSDKPEQPQNTQEPLPSEVPPAAQQETPPPQ